MPQSNYRSFTPIDLIGMYINQAYDKQPFIQQVSMIVLSLFIKK